MKKGLKKAGKGAVLFLFVIAIVLIIMAIYHHFRLRQDASNIKPIGNLVKVDGYYMNVYTEGGKKEDGLTIVLLSGSGVAAPVYDYKVLYSKLSGEYPIL